MGKMRLILISGALVLLTLSTIVATLFLLPISKYTYEATLNDKYELLKNTESPKIVLVGGSSTAFGIDSEMIENEFGYRIVNLGVTGGITLRHCLELAKLNLNYGDIVIISPEYIHLFGVQSKKLFNKALVEFPRSFSYISLLEDPISISEILLNIQRRAQNFLGIKKPTKRNVLNRESFNRYGDIVGHLENKYTPKKKVDPYISKYEQVDIKTIKALNNFDHYAQKNGVDTYMTFSPHPISQESGNNSKEWIYKLDEEITIEIISNPDRYRFHSDYFWDTADHLNAKGRQIRTEKLIEDLKPYIKKNKD